MTYTTENLLENAYRATQQGVPLQVMVDTTYRLVIEGHGTILIGHIVAYGGVSSEDTHGHQHCLQAVKDCAEALMAEKQQGVHWSSGNARMHLLKFDRLTRFDACRRHCQSVHMRRKVCGTGRLAAGHGLLYLIT